MTAQLEYQQSLFDEPFTPAELAQANRIAAHLPDRTTLELGRSTMTGRPAWRLHAQVTAYLQVDTDELLPEAKIANILAGGLRNAMREMLEVLP